MLTCHHIDQYLKSVVEPEVWTYTDVQLIGWTGEPRVVVSKLRVSSISLKENSPLTLVRVRLVVAKHISSLEVQGRGERILIESRVGLLDQHDCCVPNFSVDSIISSRSPYL